MEVEEIDVLSIKENFHRTFQVHLVLKHPLLLGGVLQTALNSDALLPALYWIVHVLLQILIKILEAH